MTFSRGPKANQSDPLRLVSPFFTLIPSTGPHWLNSTENYRVRKPSPFGAYCWGSRVDKNRLKLETKDNLAHLFCLSCKQNRIALSVYNTYHLYYSCEINVYIRHQLFLNCLDLFFLKSILPYLCVSTPIRENLKIFKSRDCFTFSSFSQTLLVTREVLEPQYFVTAYISRNVFSFAYQSLLHCLIITTPFLQTLFFHHFQ